MSDQVLHDVANLLTSMLAAAHDASVDLRRARQLGSQDDSLEDSLKAAQESLFFLRHAGALVSHVMANEGRRPPSLLEPQRESVTQLGTALDLAIAAARPILSDRVQLHVQPGLDPSVQGHQHDLAMVFFNLFLNAYQAICKRPGDSGRIDVSVFEKHRQIQVQIRDDGPGMSDRQLLNAFRSGYSGRGGMGLGLSICSQTVARYGGHMQIRSHAGLVVVVVLQRASPQSDELNALAG